MNNIVRKRIEIIGKLLIGGGLVIFLINYVEPENIISTFKKADKTFIIIALLLVPLNIFLQFSKWKILCKNYFCIKESKSVWLSLFYGISGGIFTPMKSGEYIARALPLKDVKLVDVILATAVDKVFSLIFILLIGGILSLIFFSNIFKISLVLNVVLIVLYIILLAIPIFIFLDTSNRSISLRSRLRQFLLLKKIIDKFSFLRKIDKSTFLKLLLIAFLFHLTFTVQMTILLSAFSWESNFIQFLYVANLVIFTQIVIPPIAFGEIGVREGAAVYFIKYFGYTSAVGFNAAISLFTINLLFPSLIGFALLLRRN